jgi:predicted translin family RNA/ssDNA-binding protein
MKKFAADTTEEMSMQAPNYMAILAIVGEMARHVNENISKIDLKPLQQTLRVGDWADSTDSTASNQ